ncbi:MAG: aminotransferase class IV [Myxococcota bacterium]|nr:aminotransferase class IV [Myxococcota bacterium]
MTATVWIDGKRFSAEAAQVSVFDRGFLYGDSVFETLRTYGKRPFALEEHLSRLERSAERVLIRLPLDRDGFRREVNEALAAVDHDESVLRLMLTRGRGESLGLDPGLSTTPLRVMLVMPLVAPPAQKYEAGIGVITYQAPRLADGTAAAGAKVGNYLAAVLAIDAARKASAEEALFVDTERRVLEGSTSNVFAVLGGRLVTPPEELGILPGITRAHVLSLALRRGLRTEIRPVLVDELFQAEELFISSSIRELLPVVSVDGRRIGDGRPGPTTLALLSDFREAARAG